MAFQATFWIMSFLLSFFPFFWPLISKRFEGEKIQRFGILVASPAGVCRGARTLPWKRPRGRLAYSETYWIGYGNCPSMNIYYAVEPRYNEPLYNEVLGMINIFLPKE